jgi:hypothetical protein
MCFSLNNCSMSVDCSAAWLMCVLLLSERSAWIEQMGKAWIEQMGG